MINNVIYCCFCYLHTHTHAHQIGSMAESFSPKICLIYFVFEQNKQQQQQQLKTFHFSLHKKGWRAFKSTLQLTWISVSRENRTSDRSRWWIYDHLNSGIRNGGRDGPGLNIGRFDVDFERFCLWSMWKIQTNKHKCISGR